MLELIRADTIVHVRTAKPVFQDPLFSRERTVQRTLANDTVLRLKLEPLPEERVRVLEYHRQPPGGAWGRQRGEEGRVLPFAKLRLPQTFSAVFGQANVQPV